jgi:pimeloyl-ACP methyl ester carboxylesterase
MRDSFVGLARSLLFFGTHIAACIGASHAIGAPSVPSRDGLRIAYEVHGEQAGTDPVLVLVHGWSCDRSYWRDQLEPLSQRFKVIAIDLGGHGDSGLGRSAWTIASFGDDVAAVVEALDLKRVVLVGHSMGGDVIIEAARRVRTRVSGLVWVDDYKQLGSPRSAQQAQSFIAPFEADFVNVTRKFVRGMFAPSSDPALVERVALDMSSAPQDVAVGALKSAMSFDREVPRALLELKIEVVALNSAHPPTDKASLLRYGVETVEIEDTGHFLMLEKPRQFNAALVKIIEGFED